MERKTCGQCRHFDPEAFTLKEGARCAAGRCNKLGIPGEDRVRAAGSPPACGGCFEARETGAAIIMKIRGPVEVEKAA